MSRSSAVIFDFDGPICGLFAHRPADAIALRLVELAVKMTGTTSDEIYSSDPLVVLQNLASLNVSADVLNAVDAVLVEEEVLAAASAEPTDGIKHLWEILILKKVRIAIASNNSELAVRTFLEMQSMISVPIAGRIPGRPELMKPAPDCLLRARTELGEATPIIAFVGDSVSDAIAADRAGVPFIGYAVNARKYAPLLNYGVRRLVKSVSDVETMVVD